MFVASYDPDPSALRYPVLVSFLKPGGKLPPTAATGSSGLWPFALKILTSGDIPSSAYRETGLPVKCNTWPVDQFSESLCHHDEYNIRHLYNKGKWIPGDSSKHLSLLLIPISPLQAHISSSVVTFLTWSSKYLKALRVNNRSKDDLHMNDVCEWECVTEEGCRSIARTERSLPLCPHSKDQVRSSDKGADLFSVAL